MVRRGCLANLPPGVNRSASVEIDGKPSSLDAQVGRIHGRLTLLRLLVDEPLEVT
jgi:hypothetical protein